MMTPEFKKEWIAALRSGKYSQTKGTLRDQEGFCCLGVAYDLTGRDWRETSVGTHETDENNETEFDPGIPYTKVDKLTDLNDTGHSFEEIADYIEENL